MPIYTDNKSNTLFVKFDYNGVTYKKRLPREIKKSEAKKFEAAWKSSLFLERYGLEEKPQISFEDFLVKYFLPYSEANKKSFDRDVIICKIALEFFKGRNLRDIKPSHIEEFKIKRLKTRTIHDRDRKPATVQRELSVVSKTFSLAMANDFVEFNPCQRVENLKFNNTVTRKLDEKDDERFFAAFESERARDICQLILNTGLRQNDAVGLQRSHIDWGTKEIRLIQGKTGVEIAIPINATVKTLLQKWLNKHDCPYVFPSPKTGTKGTSVKKAVIGACHRSKVPYSSVRDLRRTAASRMLERGVNHITIAAILGHTDLRMVQRYAQSNSEKRRTVKLLENQNRAKIVPTRKKKKHPTNLSA